MKTKLLTLASCFLTLIIYSQKNGWHQYHKTAESFSIDVSNSGEIQLGTDTGHLVYNPNSNSVSHFANLTSHNQPIGKIRGIKSNPTNNEIIMLGNDGTSLIVYDGSTDYTFYNESNSDYGNFETINFTPANLDFNDQGMLYIYHVDDSRYQTFENGMFSPVQNLNFNPNDIIESEDGNKVYFASFNGLWELNRSSETFTNFTTSNSDIHTNFIYALHRDSSGLIYLGGVDGISTLDTDTNEFSLVYQDNWDINPAVIYDVESINVFSDERLLVKTQPLGWATLDLGSDEYTYFTNEEFCNPRNVAIANDEIYVQPAFGELTVFDPNTITCTEKNTNHLNVGDVGLFGALGIAIRPAPNDTDSIDVLWTNNAICGPTQTCSMYSLTVPLDFSSGPFADANADISVSDAGLNEIAVLDINNKPAVVVGETNGYRILEEDGTEHTIAHGVDGYRPFRNEFVVEGQNSENPPDTPRIAVLSGGFDSNNNFVNNIANIITDGNTLSGLTQVLFNNAITSNAGFVGRQEDPSKVKFSSTFSREDLNRIYAQIEWDFDNGTYQIPFEEDISVHTNNRPDPLFIGRENVEARFQSSTDRKICTRNGTTGEYECEDFDFNQDAENDQILKPETYEDSPVVAGDLAEALFIGLSGITPSFVETRDLGLLSILSGDTSSRNSQNSLSIQQLPDVSLNGLPEDFFILDSFIYIYNQTHLAAALSTTYGLIVNTAIDYSSLTLGADDITLNEKNMRLHPNPANDIVSFSNKAVVKVDLFDINGRKILESREPTFSVKDLVNGVYIVKAIKRNGTVISQKLIKN